MSFLFIFILLIGGLLYMKCQKEQCTRQNLPSILFDLVGKVIIYFYDVAKYAIIRFREI